MQPPVKPRQHFNAASSINLFRLRYLYVIVFCMRIQKSVPICISILAAEPKSAIVARPVVAVSVGTRPAQPAIKPVLASLKQFGTDQHFYLNGEAK